MSLYLDHRQLADEMELIAFDEQVGAGLPLWLPRGAFIRDALEDYMRKVEFKSLYGRVYSPHIGKEELYEKSGHLKAFSENMFPPMNWGEDEGSYYLRPMNCPHHHKIFSAKMRSYRELPLRMSEHGQVYRYENSGSLKGLSRVRGLCQNDAHVYVAEKDVKDEVRAILKIHLDVYRNLQLKNFRFRLSKHDPALPDVFHGEVEKWRASEEILRSLLVEMNLPFYEAAGEAAFYGPKIDVQMAMGAGSEESIASVQIDFNSSLRFDLKFINAEGKEERPWILHRAPMGSHERFVALLLEIHQGQLPWWLAPVQIYLIPMNDEALAYARAFDLKLKQELIRCEVFLQEGSLAKKLRQAHKARPFCYVVLGHREMQERVWNLQFRDQSLQVPEEQVLEFLKSRSKAD